RFVGRQHSVSATQGCGGVLSDDDRIVFVKEVAVIRTTARASTRAPCVAATRASTRAPCVAAASTATAAVTITVAVTVTGVIAVTRFGGTFARRGFVDAAGATAEDGQAEGETGEGNEAQSGGHGLHGE